VIGDDKKEKQNIPHCRNSSYRKIVDIEAKSIPLTYIHYRSLSDFLPLTPSPHCDCEMQNRDKFIYFPQFQINSFWSLTFKSFCDEIKLFTTNLSDINLLIDWFINWLLSKAKFCALSGEATHTNFLQGPSWSWSYFSYIHNEN